VSIPCLLLGVLLFQANAVQALATEAGQATEGPWDQSVRLEREGDLQGAEATVVSTWGSEPDNFYVQLRLAYLALLGRRGPEAVARYEKARGFAEADGDDDATAGYAAALALNGWALAEQGQRREARRWWTKALAVAPGQPQALAGLRAQSAAVTEPEVWGALVGQSFGSGQYQASAIFAQVPWRPVDGLRLRLAGRHISWHQVSPTSPWSFSNQPATAWAVNEVYGGAAYENPAVMTEALAFAITTAGSPTLSGGGLRFIAGGDWGVSADGAALFRANAWANQQLRPLVFLAIGGWLVPYAGVRITRDGGKVWTSGTAGTSLSHGPFSVYLQGHLGTERWAADLTSPSVQSITPTSRKGGSLTVFWDVSHMFRLGGQWTSDVLAADGATGSFWSAALGLQVRMFTL
jgi:hypothetical protein